MLISAPFFDINFHIVAPNFEVSIADYTFNFAPTIIIIILVAGNKRSPPGCYWACFTCCLVPLGQFISVTYPRRTVGKSLD